jgi:hypothetical protein
MRKRSALLAAVAFAAATMLSATTGALPAHAEPAHVEPTQSVPSPQPIRVLRRVKVDGGRLVTSGTGATFRPRGANYVRLHPSPKGYAYHSTFEPGQYDSAAAAAMLTQLKHDGYNVVRVFIDAGDTDPNAAHGIGRGTGTTGYVHEPYMDNVADFVRRAARHGVYVLPTLDYFPQNDYYWGIVTESVPDTGIKNMDGENLNFLNAGHVAAKAEYLKRFAEALRTRVGPSVMSAILAYSSNNEAFFQGDKAPFNSTGEVTPLNGETYDMNSAADRQQAADESIAEYTHRLKRALVTTDPDALLTIGAFTPYAVHKNGFDGLKQPQDVPDTRFPARLAAITQFGAVDFVDVHVYPDTPDYRVASDLQTAESGLFTKPFIVGEMGAFKHVYGDVSRAAFGMRDLQIATCSSGAQGWLFWTWDTHEDLANQRKFFHLSDSGGAINGQLAPITRPDPCR